MSYEGQTTGEGAFGAEAGDVRRMADGEGRLGREARDGLQGQAEATAEAEERLSDGIRDAMGQYGELCVIAQRRMAAEAVHSVSEFGDHLRDVAKARTFGEAAALNAVYLQRKTLSAMFSGMTEVGGGRGAQARNGA